MLAGWFSHVEVRREKLGYLLDDAVSKVIASLSSPQLVVVELFQGLELGKQNISQRQLR